jgi:hypothetical protein
VFFIGIPSEVSSMSTVSAVPGQFIATSVSVRSWPVKHDSPLWYALVQALVILMLAALPGVGLTVNRPVEATRLPFIALAGRDGPGRPDLGVLRRACR